MGCHGRQEDVNAKCVGGGGTQVECGAGAGLRRSHELNAGAGTCKSCHSQDPIPVGEDKNPFYYGKSGVQMINACDADSSECRYGAKGLDNDGDGPIDGSDSNCQLANSLPTQPGTLSASAVTASSVTVSWGASTDANGDTITYQVDCLVEFLNSPDADASAYFSAIDTGTNPVLYSIVATANAAAGESYYNANCFSCHGDPAGVSPVGSPAGGNGFAINPGLSGNWWGGASRAGEGFLIDVATNILADTVLVVSFYTYNNIGDQVWLVGSGAVTGNTGVIDLFIPAGAMWGAAFNPADRTETAWGSGTFSFLSCGSGHIALAPNQAMLDNGFTSLEYDINRDLLIPGITCPISAQ